MNLDPTIAVVGAGTALVLGAMVALALSTRGIRRERLDEAARRHGWTLHSADDPGGTTFTLSPADRAWRIEVRARTARSGPGTSPATWSSGGSFTRWSAASPALDAGLLAVRPGAIPPQAVSLGGGSGPLRALLARALSEIAGGDPGPLDTLAVAPTGDPAFDARFAVIASDPSLVARWLTPPVRAALAHWRGPGEGPAMLLSRNGIRLAMPDRWTDDPGTLGALADLGERLRVATAGR